MSTIEIKIDFEFSDGMIQYVLFESIEAPGHLYSYQYNPEHEQYVFGGSEFLYLFVDEVCVDLDEVVNRIADAERKVGMYKESFGKVPDPQFIRA